MKKKKRKTDNPLYNAMQSLPQMDSFLSKLH